MKRRLLSLVLASAMVLSVTACGSEPSKKATGDAGNVTSENTGDGQDAAKEESAAPSSEETQAGPDTSDAVVLKIYGVGNEGGTYNDEIIEAINKITSEEINATIDLNMISWGDYSTKLPAIMASGEDYDLIYTSTWCFFKTEGPKGAFYELTPEMLQSCMPKTYAEYPETAWQQGSIDGKVYMVPCVINEFDSTSYVIRGDLRKKYNVPEVKTTEDLEAYMAAIKENETGMIPYKGSATDNFQTGFVMYPNDFIPSGGVIAGGVVAPYDDASVVEAAYKQEATKEFYGMMHDWYSKGYIANDILASKTSSGDNFKTGTSGIAATSLNNASSLRQDIIAANADWELEYVDFEGDSKVQRIAYNGNGMAVGRNSKNAERALMFLELVYQNQDLYDLINYGIEGKTYVLNEDGSYSTPEGANPNDLQLPQLWMGLRTAKFDRTSASEWDVVTAKKAEYAKKAYDNPLVNVTYDLTEVQAEIAAIKNLYDQYQVPMEWGVVDPEEQYDDLMQKFQDAGMEKVMEVVRKQVADQLDLN